jgi:hypothetical protein
MNDSDSPTAKKNIDKEAREAVANGAIASKNELN